MAEQLVADVLEIEGEEESLTPIEKDPVADVLEIEGEEESLTPIEKDPVLMMTDHKLRKEWINYPLSKELYLKT